MADRRVVLGNGAFLHEHGIEAAGLSEAAEDLRGDGATAIPAGVDGKLAGTLAIADPVKAPTPAALAALRREGVPVVMFTGDNWTTAVAVAVAAGLLFPFLGTLLSPMIAAAAMVLPSVRVIGNALRLRTIRI